MKKTKLFLTVSLLLCSLTSTHAQKYVGGDLSVLLKYEEQKATYLDKDGKAIADVLAFVKEQGWNTVRMRLFADPSKDTDKNVCQDIEYVKSLGKRIKAAGLCFMLDFHYSDTWADPEHQTMPLEWGMINTPAFEYIYTYTKTNLEALVTAAATPDFIQIGNEISFGMLWDGCKVSANSNWTAYEDTNWDNFSTALKNASKACREVCPEAKIVIHTEQCTNNPTLDVAFFKRIQQYDIDYDIIGTSYYPYFKGPLANLDKGLSELEKNFPDKQIQLVETGYPSKWEVEGSTYDYTKTYPYSHEGQRQYAADLIATLKKHPQVNGLSWWYAEANAKGCTGSLAEGWYNASLFDNETGRALPALYELKAFDDGSTGIGSISADRQHTDDAWYSLSGRRLEGWPQQKGLYINNGKTVVVK
jgi:arabinogalactan endo-1,4-beta-galactosidase